MSGRREPAEQGAWDHQPDPAAVDSGFYVDWGTPDAETPPGWDVFVDTAASAAARRLPPRWSNPIAVDPQPYALESPSRTNHATREPYTRRRAGDADTTLVEYTTGVGTLSEPSDTSPRRRRDRRDEPSTTIDAADDSPRPRSCPTTSPTWSPRSSTSNRLQDLAPISWHAESGLPYSRRRPPLRRWSPTRSRPRRSRPSTPPSRHR